MKQNTNKLLNDKEKRLGLILWIRFVRFVNKNSRQSNQFLNQWNLSTAQFDVLAQIGSYTHGRLTQQELAKRMLVTKGNVTLLLKKMEDVDLIIREQEWKNKYISLTKKGEQLYNEVVPQQEQLRANQFRGLNREEQKQLLYLLKKIQK
ncbi:MarR family winged helix-turn-helix transcriptional regulator [Chengkuizengella sediminis]|uniref:MarR family winged helix-turn-helix transcriptional regulator n=1 Tax=Chengkuizengella sediminis TaxID=1885917 RepID=UPI0013895F8F|nr:MarR family transcriptional regulator [Chengkuizengella sediminis]NDI34679.1 MarR family transcriptional regulator [Chengkuizengella sediminis]